MLNAVLTHRLLLLGLWTLLTRATAQQDIIIAAFSSAFTLRDDTIVRTTKVPAIEWVCGIMKRQNIPCNGTEIRLATDTELLSLGMRAAVAGISPWKRDVFSDRIVLHERSGAPIPETLISDIEVPVYISIICIMAITIILQHMQAQQSTMRSKHTNDDTTASATKKSTTPTP